MTRHRKLLIGGAVLLALAGALYGTLRAVYGQRAAYVHVRWAPNVDPATQEQVERGHSLARVEFRELRTWLYYLTDVSTENIRSLVAHPAVEDTHHINRTAFGIARTAERGPYLAGGSAWLAELIEFIVDAASLAGAVALAGGAFYGWRDRRGGVRPPGAA